jgi:hypothetical protein
LGNIDEVVLCVNEKGEMRWEKVHDPNRKSFETSPGWKVIGSAAYVSLAEGEILFQAICMKAPEGKAVTFNIPVDVDHNVRISHIVSSRMLFS